MNDEFTGTKRQVNELMRDGLRARGAGELIGFVCECADDSCYQAVWLTGHAYDRARSDPGWIALSPGHARPLQTAG